MKNPTVRTIGPVKLRATQLLQIGYR